MLFISCAFSCEKKEPAAQPVPDEIMRKILADFSQPDGDAINSDCVEYISEQKGKELTDGIINVMYSKDDKPVDMSKIEKYAIRQSKEIPAVEIGIFKLYDKVTADYVKDMANNRIAKMRGENKNNGVCLETANNAEARSYGNYVYYVSHPQKDKIFRIIENMLRDKDDKIQRINIYA